MTQAALPPTDREALQAGMARDNQDRLTYYRKLIRDGGITLEGAAELLLQSHAEGRLQQIREKPARELRWDELSALAEENEAEAYAWWDEVKAAARKSLEGGEQAGLAVENGYSGPMERALFGALRQSLLEEWQPTGASERLLIEQLAQIHTLGQVWTRVAAVRAGQPHRDCDRASRMGGGWELPRVSDVEAQIQALEMMDRSNRMFIRTLRALRDLRRYQPVIVQNSPGGQVNIGQQQVNVQANRTETLPPAVEAALDRVYGEADE